MKHDETLTVLRKAASGTLPASINETSPIHVRRVLELVDAGYLKASCYPANSGPIINDVHITTAGREYLLILEERVRSTSFYSKAMRYCPAAIKWAFGIIGALIVAYLVRWLAL